MLGESLDLQLELALDAMRLQNWKQAREILAARLDESASLGRQRLTLYLLSVTATSSGHPEAGDQFAQVARSVPIELGEPRYFQQPDDSLRDLELGWWTFNGWGSETVQSCVASTADLSAPLPWADILDSVLEGRAGELERRWAEVLEGAHPHRWLLWNFVALAYLEQGDPRTYDEMRLSAPSGQEPPDDLLALLEHADLQAAIRALQGQQWLTSDLLQAEQAAPVDTDNSQLAWVESMEEAFSLLSMGRAQESARKFGPLCEPPYSSVQRGYALRALAMALGDCGEYSAAEDAVRESQIWLGQQCDDVMDTRFAIWADSVRKEAKADVTSSFSQSEDVTGSSGMYWTDFGSVLEAMRAKEFQDCKPSLRRLLSAQGQLDDATYPFLTALLFAGIAILEGDHVEAQDSIGEAVHHAESATLNPEILQEASRLFFEFRAETLGSKLNPNGLSTLDPWRDFPSDFLVDLDGFYNLDESLG